MKEITVRPFTIEDVRNRLTVMDLPVTFKGTEQACRDYCEMLGGYEWRKDESIFGGYYAHEDGNCLLLV